MSRSTLVAIAIAIAIAIVAPCCIAESSMKPCNAHDAKAAEESIDLIGSWQDAQNYYGKFGHCLDGSVAYGFDNKLAELLAQPDGVHQLWRSGAIQQSFRNVVAEHVVGEAFPIETIQRIRENLRSRCPDQAKRYCRRLEARLAKICSACQR